MSAVSCKHLFKQCAGLILLVTLFSLSACGYHTAGSSGSRIGAGQSLWVSFIGIETDSPSAQTVVRRALLEECHALRGLYPSGNAAAADLRIQGRLRSYANRAMSYSELDQVREYRLTVELELELFRKGEPVPVWKGVLQSYQDFPANQDLALQKSAEEAALAAVSRTIARKFLMAVEQAY